MAESFDPLKLENQICFPLYVCAKEVIRRYKPFLDSGTLTPLLKTLEKKGFVRRERSETDERVVNVTLTETGQALREKALTVPKKISHCIDLSPEDAAGLYGILHRFQESLKTDKQ